MLTEKCGCGGTGRRAGLRNQCQRRGGSSPLIRTNNEKVEKHYSYFYLLLLFFSI